MSPAQIPLVLPITQSVDAVQLLTHSPLSGVESQVSVSAQAWLSLHAPPILPGEDIIAPPVPAVLVGAEPPSALLPPLVAGAPALLDAPPEWLPALELAPAVLAGGVLESELPLQPTSNAQDEPASKATPAKARCESRNRSMRRRNACWLLSVRVPSFMIFICGPFE